MPVCLAPSANWYSAGALSSNGEDLMVSCARCSLVVASPNTAGAAPGLDIHGVIHDAHQERATAALIWRQDGEVSVVSCGQDATVKLWVCSVAGDENGETTQTHFQYRCHRQHNAHGSQPAVSLDRSPLSPHVVVSVDERGVFIVWDWLAHTTRRVQPLDKCAPTELRCSPHIDLVVAVAGKRGLLCTVSLAAGGRVLQRLRGHDQDVTSICWCPELTDLLAVAQDHLLASAARDHTIRVWGTRSGRCHVLQPLRLSGAEGRHHPAARSAAGGGGDHRAWLTLLWTSARRLYSSGLSGQLLTWRLADEKDRCQVVHRSHGRTLFNVAALAGGGLVVSSGIERSLVVCDITQQLSGIVPTLGGAVHALHSCPIDPARLAIGCADSTIRVWNLSAVGGLAITSHWQGIKAKVLTVAWHPEDDSRLAYGTDEGRVGVCFPNSSNKPALVCSDHHAGPVYCVAWAGSATGGHVLFSLSLGEVWRHEPSKLVASTWSAAHGRAACSQMAFGGGGVAIGRQDGSVQLMTSWGVVRGSAIGHRKLVTSLAWAPVTSAHGDKRATTALAVGSYDTHVGVFDVPRLDAGEGDAAQWLLQARLTLTGHRARVLAVAWSPHLTNTLVTASQDNTVRVWDADMGWQRAVYSGHVRPVRCCLVHPLWPGGVMSGGDDCSLHQWRVAQQPAQPPPALKPAGEMASESAGAPTFTAGGRKKKNKKKKKAAEGTIIFQKEELSSDLETETSSVPGADQPRDLGDGRKTRTPRSLFPLSAAAENRGKVHSQADIEHLLDTLMLARQPVTLPEQVVTSQDGGVTSDGLTNDGNPEGKEDANRYAHLGLFSGEEAFKQMLHMEESHHRAQRADQQLTQFAVWRGDIATLVRSAASQAKLTDQLLALAPMVSYKFWKEMSVEYARQLENEKEISRASAVLLACHQVTEAISLLARHGQYREAVCICRSRLPADHPSQGVVLRDWAQQLTAEGNLELAAKCYLGVGDAAAAAGVLSRRADAHSLQLAARLSGAAGEQVRSRSLALQALHGGCLRAEWPPAVAAAALTTQPQAALRLALAHRELVGAVSLCSAERLLCWAAQVLDWWRPPTSARAPTGAAAASVEPAVAEEPEGTHGQTSSDEPGRELSNAAVQQACSAGEGDRLRGTAESTAGEATDIHLRSGAGARGSDCDEITSVDDAPVVSDGVCTTTVETDAPPRGRSVAGPAGCSDGTPLLERVRSTWQQHDCPMGACHVQTLREQLRDVKYSTKPSSAKQLWLSLSASVCMAASLPTRDERLDVEIANMLTWCAETVSAQLPTLCFLLVTPDVASRASEHCEVRRLVLSAVLAVLRQSLPSIDDGDNQQCAESPPGQDATRSGQHEMLPLCERVQSYAKCWATVRGVDRKEEEDRILSEITSITDRLGALK